VAVLKALDGLGVVLVASSGNAFDNKDNTVEPQIPNTLYPQMWANDADGLPNLINVGATDQLSRAAMFSMRGSKLTVYAPGQGVFVAGQNGGIGTASGTSFGTLTCVLPDLRITTRLLASAKLTVLSLRATAAPMVAGLVAYFRALPGWQNRLDSPAEVKRLLLKMQRTVQVPFNQNRGSGPTTDNRGNKYGPVVSMVWNGQLSDTVSCLAQPDAPGCPTIDLNDPTPVGDICANPPAARRRGETDDTNLAARQDGDSCPLDPGGGGGGGGGGGPGGTGDGQGPTKTITYRSGTPSPTCTTGCGTLCTDYWCRPPADRTGQPPFFTDPTNLPPDPTGLPPGCLEATTITDCNVNGLGKPCMISTSCLATALPTNCIEATTITDCNVNGLGKPCMISTSCLATAVPLPTNCVEATTVTDCNANGLGKPCLITSSCLATALPTNCAEATTITDCNANGLGNPCLIKTSCLSTLPTNCAEATTITDCNVNGLGKPCQIRTSCLATALPTNCISATTITDCNVNGLGKPCMISTSCLITARPLPT
jgi:chitinase